jgi:hypothetical protein
MRQAVDISYQAAQMVKDHAAEIGKHSDPSKES